MLLLLLLRLALTVGRGVGIGRAAATGGVFTFMVVLRTFEYVDSPATSPAPAPACRGVAATFW